MPIRTIKPQFFRSRKLANVSRDARLTLIGLWVEADGHGRGSADPHVLKGAVWPLDHDITHEIVDEHLVELASADQIVLYDVEEEPYFEVVGWEKHQAANYRRGDSQHPIPQEGTVRSLTASEQDEAPASGTFARKSVQAAHGCVLEGKGREGKGSSSTDDERPTEETPPDDFDTFWSTYPRRTERKRARTAWKNLTGKDRTAALEALPLHVAAWKREHGNVVKFIPHPTTWLNGRRWEDELEPTRAARGTTTADGATVESSIFR